jgi:hypothetical protein
MEMIAVIVESYSGYKADEYPKCFYWNNNRFEVQEVIDRWYQGDINPEWPVSDYFRIATASGTQYIIKHDIEGDIWYLCR